MSQNLHVAPLLSLAAALLVTGATLAFASADDSSSASRANATVRPGVVAAAACAPVKSGPLGY